MGRGFVRGLHGSAAGAPPASGEGGALRGEAWAWLQRPGRGFAGGRPGASFHW